MSRNDGMQSRFGEAENVQYMTWVYCIVPLRVKVTGLVLESKISHPGCTSIVRATQVALEN